MEKLWAELLIAPIGAAAFVIALAVQMTGRASPAAALLLSFAGAALLAVGLWPYSPPTAIAVTFGVIAYMAYLCREAWQSKLGRAVSWLGRFVGYVDGRWTWQIQKPWKRVDASSAAVWRERDRLELYVIACRSVGVEPTLPVDRDPQNSRMRFLGDAIRDGRLIVASGDLDGTGGGDGVMLQIRYSDLRAFAERENHAALLRFAEEWSPPKSAASGPPASAPETPPSNPHQEIDGPIAWEFGTRNSPIGTSRSAGTPLWVDAFQIKGQNISADPIHARKTAVRSDMTGRIIPLLFSRDGNLVEPTVVTIPPQGRFTLIGRISPTDSSKSLGVVVDQFREEFGAFTFTFEYGDPNFHYGNQTTYTRRFAWAEVDRILTNADVQSRPTNDRDIIIRKPPHYARAASTAKPEPDAWYLDAIFYCVHRRWLGESEQALDKPGQLDKAADFLNEFRQRARNGNIVVWGKIWENGTWDPIPAEYWAHHWVEPTELMREKPERLVSDAATPEGKNGPFYKYLKVSRSQIEDRWPPQEKV